MTNSVTHFKRVCNYLWWSNIKLCHTHSDHYGSHTMIHGPNMGSGTSRLTLQISINSSHTEPNAFYAQPNLGTDKVSSSLDYWQHATSRFLLQFTDKTAEPPPLVPASTQPNSKGMLSFSDNLLLDCPFPLFMVRYTNLDTDWVILRKLHCEQF
jgi:hypothetical protein